MAKQLPLIVRLECTAATLDRRGETGRADDVREAIQELRAHTDRPSDLATMAANERRRKAYPVSDEG